MDDAGVKASVPFYVSYNGATLTSDDLIAEWNAQGARLDAITDGVIVGGSVTIPLPPAVAWKDVAVADSTVAKTGLFNFLNDTTTRRDGFGIPAIANALVTDGRINLASAAIVAFVTALTGGFTGGNYDNAVSQGLTALVDAFLTARKRANMKRNTTVRP